MSEEKEQGKNRKKEDKKELNEQYNLLKKKHNFLPDFEELCINFEIDDIDPDENILREIIKEMHSTVEFYTRILEGLIQPDSKLSDMKEAESLTKEDQENILGIYRKCMLINRSLLLSNLQFNEEECAKEISITNSEWNKIKKELKIILLKMKDTWKEEKKKETHGGYYG